MHGSLQHFFHEAANTFFIYFLFFFRIKNILFLYKLDFLNLPHFSKTYEFIIELKKKNVYILKKWAHKKFKYEYK